MSEPYDDKLFLAYVEKRLVQWVEYHLPNKSDDDLWYLNSKILEELGKRDKHRYQVGIGLSFKRGN
tara:strand:+ start:169 stop:366 length:198 start_codon:yes stop_codon:yes gene_type:complete